MGCQFCASTIAGYVRDLMPSELLLQIYETQRDAGCRIDSIVLMGIGEPLDNFENVVQFFRILSHPDGMQMSLRHVALSTCGLVAADPAAGRPAAGSDSFGISPQPREPAPQ